MTLETTTRHRKSIRLQDYDYSQVGMYFITICTHDRLPRFGEIIDGEMILNEAGRMVERHWDILTRRFVGIRLHDYITMPNHVHGVIEIVGAPLVGALDPTHPAANRPPSDSMSPERRATTRVAPTIGDFAGAFKSLTTLAYIDGVKTGGWLPFNRRVWQRNYHEHIIRNETAYLKISEYIRTNPQRWLDDTYYI